MNDPRFPKFKMSERVKAWASLRPGPDVRPSGIAPPCVGCADRKALPVEPGAVEDPGEEEVE